MKKKIRYILLTAILFLLFSGCGAGGDETNETKESLDSDGQIDISGPYSAVVNVPLQVEKPAKAIEGGGARAFLGISGAYRFKKHLFENVDDCWDELVFVSINGETASESFDLEHQLWSVGPVAGTNHYVIFNSENQEGDVDCRYFLTEKSETHQVLREFPLDFLDGRDFSEVIMSISAFAVDCSDTVHLLWSTEDGYLYQLVSQAGEVLAEYTAENETIEGLALLYDGRVAFYGTKWDIEGQGLKSLQYMDAETGKPVLLAAPEENTRCFTLFDDETLLYADYEGVYRSDLSGENPELLYSWTDHGIEAQDVSVLQADEEGRVMLLYEDSAEKYNYLCLEPGAEETVACTITLAVNSFRMSAYRPMVAEFNKRYKDYRIELKSDYDETALLTELASGKGPVLVDTLLTGFEKQEELWDPLDAIVDQPGIKEELLPSVLELGKINGTLYGIVTDFRLRTLAIKNSDIKDWDYGLFLQRLQDSSDLEGIFNLYGGDYGAYFIMNFFSHGIDDTYLLDAEVGTTNFDSNEFRKILELAKEYCVREDEVKPGSSLLEGKVFCNELIISKPEELSLYRVCYGEDADYIGYPTKDGAACFIESGGSPLAVRRTATEKEKEAAYAFLGICLSYEGQDQAAKDLNFGLSVRKDVLEEQIAAMNKDTEVFKSGFGMFRMGNDLNIELDRNVLLDMIDEAKPWRNFPAELSEICYEELEQYFAGAITEDMVIDHLENRVGLYLGERNFH